MAAEFAFVAAGPLGKPGSADRSLIRSRCMRGRNAREGSRRSVQQAKRDARLQKQAGPPRLPIYHASIKSISLHPSSLPCRAWTSKGIQKSATDNTDQGDGAAGSGISPQQANNRIFSQFDAGIERKSREVMQTFFDFESMISAIYPIHSFVDVESVEDPTYYWLYYDTDFYQSVVFASSAFSDLVGHKMLTARTQNHLQTALSMLNTRLSTIEYASDSTIHIVFILAASAAMLRDHGATRAHLSGLYRLVMLRGGLDYLRNRPNLHFKLDRLILYWFLFTGQKPRFPTPYLSWAPIQRAPRSLTPDGFDPLIRAGLLDPKILIAVRDLQELVATIHETTSNNSRLSWDKLQYPLATIQSRLFELEDEVDSITSKCLRLGMLALLTTMYQLPGNRLPYSYLNTRFRASIRAMELSIPTLVNLTIWLVMIGVITVWDAQEPWLREIWDNIVPEALWIEVNPILQCFFWLPSIHDEFGQKAFDQLGSRNTLNKLVAPPGTCAVRS